MSAKQLLIVGSGVVSTLWFEDQFSGIRFGVRFVRPTSEQRIRWNSILYRRDRKGRLIGSLAEANITIGRELIVGIEPDCIAGPDGVAMSSDPGTPGYRADWRALAVESGCLDQAAIYIAIQQFSDAKISAATPVEAAAKALLLMRPYLRSAITDEKAAELLLMLMQGDEKQAAEDIAESAASETESEPVVTEGNLPPTSQLSGEAGVMNPSGESA